MVGRGPVYKCLVCGRTQNVVPDGRGFPPDIAKRKLIKGCTLDGHKSDPLYLAGFSFASGLGID